MTQQGMSGRSVLSSRAKLAGLAGLQFDGNRDLYATLGYPKKLPYEYLLARYLRQDICSRIVNIYPEAMWARPPVPGPDAEGMAQLKLRAAERKREVRRAREQIEAEVAQEQADREHEVALEQAKSGGGKGPPFGKPPGKGGGFGGRRTAFAPSKDEQRGEKPARGVGDNGGPQMDPNDEVEQAKFEIDEANAPENQLKKSFLEIARRTRLWHYVQRADKLAGVGKYSVLLLGFDDVTGAEGLSQPVQGANDLLYVQAYGESQVSILEFVNDPRDEAFGLPQRYQLRMVDSVSNGRLINVHRSRIVHVADCLMDSEVEGVPILERVYNRLLDIEKIVGGSAEMFWLSARHGLHIDVDPAIRLSADTTNAMSQEIEDYLNGVQRVLRTRGTKVNPLGSDAVDPSGAFGVVMNAIAVTTGVPVKILLGAELGSAASEQDRTNWATRIEERRKVYAEPVILDQLIQKCIDAGVLPDMGWEWGWPDAFPMSPLERAQTSAQQAAAAASLASAWNIVPEVVTEEEGRGLIFSTNMTTRTVQENELQKEGSYVKVAAASGAAGVPGGKGVSGTYGDGGKPGKTGGVGASGRASRGGDGFASDVKKYGEGAKGTTGGKTTGRVDALSK